MAANLLSSTFKTVSPTIISFVNTKPRLAPCLPPSNLSARRPAVRIFCHSSQPMKPLILAARSSDKSTQEPSTFGDAYLQVGKRTICTKPGLMLQTMASVQEPYKEQTETEGQGPVPPGGNNIRNENFDHQRQHKTPPKKEKVKVLLIGKGNMRMKIVEVAVKNGYAIYALVGDTTPSDPFELGTVQKCKDLGVTIIPGDMDNHEDLVKAVKAVDVVISVLGYAELAYQIKIINAIKEAGNIKRFIISAEFVNGAGPGHAVDPALMYENMAQLKQIVETARIPYTFISYNIHAGLFLPCLGGIGTLGYPADKVTISGDGNLKVVFLAEEGVATWTVKSIDDPRTMNKILYMGPPENTKSHNEFMSLCKKKV